MQYQKAEIKNGRVKIIESKKINQNELTSGCWLIQFDGLSTCETCNVKNTPECGGQAIRKQLLEK